MSAYETVADAIRGVLPSGWQWVGYETPAGPISPDAPTVELKLRSGRPLPQAPLGAWELDWIVTLTTQYPDREVAEPALADQVIDLVVLIESIGQWIGCSEFTKALNDDGRLAFDVTVQARTEK